jgi:hypothetical protein
VLQVRARILDVQWRGTHTVAESAAGADVHASCDIGFCL